MQSAGGFLLDDLSSIVESQSSSATDPIDLGTPNLSLSTTQPLTAKQEARLRSYLDISLTTLSRGYRKRFDPQSQFPSLLLYLEGWNKLLAILARVPPYGVASINLLLSYLLRCTNELTDGIRGYGLRMETQRVKRERNKSKPAQEDDQDEQPSDPEDNDEQEDKLLHNQQLNYLLETLDLLDRVWNAILRGHIIDYPVAKNSAHRAFSDQQASSTDENAANKDQAPFKSRYDATMFALGSNRPTSSLVPYPAIDVCFPNAASTSSMPTRESAPVQGGKGPKTVGQTDRVRLRNIVVSAREELFVWMRKELEAPPPPDVDDIATDAEPDDILTRLARTTDSASGSAVKQEANDQEADEDSEDMEDVPIEGQLEAKEEIYDPEEDTEEHQHFQQLFDKKIDPDVDDSDAEQEPQAEERALSSSLADSPNCDNEDFGLDLNGSDEEKEEAKVGQHKRARSSSASSPGPDSKRKKEPQNNVQDSAPSALRPNQSELGSMQEAMQTDSIVQWDLAFTRLFSKTLRTLSDLAESQSNCGQNNSIQLGHGIGSRGEAEQQPEEDVH